MQILEQSTLKTEKGLNIFVNTIFMPDSTKI
jgi:hypothetical protein